MVISGDLRGGSMSMRNGGAEGADAWFYCVCPRKSIATLVLWDNGDRSESPNGTE
jgi:hypothetical protein